VWNKGGGRARKMKTDVTRDIRGIENPKVGGRKHRLPHAQSRELMDNYITNARSSVAGKCRETFNLGRAPQFEESATENSMIFLREI
jgi:hypothetical protein